MKVGDVYAGPRHGRQYRVVEIGPELGKVRVLALYDPDAKPESAIAALMTPENGWHLVPEKRCENCGHFTIGTDGGSTSRDGEMFGLCERAGKRGSLTQPARLDKPAGRLGHPGPLGPRSDGQPHSQEAIDAYERYVRGDSWQYGTVYQDRTLLYVRPTFGCVEHASRRIRELPSLAAEDSRPWESSGAWYIARGPHGTVWTCSHLGMHDVQNGSVVWTPGASGRRGELYCQEHATSHGAPGLDGVR